MTLPDDENATVLHRMAARGIDLSSARMINFEHVFPDQRSAQQFMSATMSAFSGMNVCSPEKEDQQKWNVRCRQRMVPSHGGITEIESALAKLARDFGGHADGWGFLSNPDGSPAD